MQLVNLTLVRDTVPSLLEEVSYNSFVPVEAIEIIKNTALNPSEDLPKYPLQVEEQRTSVSLDGSNVPHRYLVELLEDKTLIHFKVPGGEGWLNLQCISIINDVMNSDKDAYQIIKYNTGITSEFLQAKSSLQEISTIVEMNANDAWEDRARESPSKLATIRAYCTFIQDFIDKYPSIVHNIYQDKLRDQFLDDEGASVHSQAVEFIKFSEMSQGMQNELAIDILLSLYFQQLDSTRWFGKKSAIIVPSQEDNSSQLKAMRVAITSEKVPHLKFESTLACTFSESKYKVSCRINPGFEQRGATHSISLEQLKAQLIGVEHTDIETIKAWLAIALQDCYIGLVRMTTPKLSTMRLRLNNFHTTIKNIPIKLIEDTKTRPVHEQDPFMAKIIQAYENSTN